MGIADILIDVFAAESALLRAQRLGGVYADMARLYLAEAQDRAAQTAQFLLPYLEEGDDLRVLMAAARRLTKRDPFDQIALARRVAEAVLEAEGYPQPRA